MSNEPVLVESSLAFDPFCLEKSYRKKQLELNKWQFSLDELLVEVSYTASYYRKDTFSLDNLLRLAEQNNKDAIYSIAAIYCDESHSLYNLALAKPWLIKAIQAQHPEKLTLYAKYFECFSEFTVEDLMQTLGVDTIKVDEWFFLGNLQLGVEVDKQTQDFELQTVRSRFKELNAFLNDSQQKLPRIKAVLPFYMRGVLAGDLKECLSCFKRLLEELKLSIPQKKLFFAEIFPKQNKFSEAVTKALLDNFASLLPDAAVVDIYCHYPELCKQYFSASFLAEKIYQAVASQFKQHQRIDESIRNLLEKAPENSMIVGIKMVMTQWDKKIHQAYHHLKDRLEGFKNPGWIERIFRWFEDTKISDEVVKSLERLQVVNQDSDPQQQQLKLQKAIENVLLTKDISFRLSWRLNHLLSELKKDNNVLPNLSDIFILPDRSEKQVSETDIHQMHSNIEIWLPVFAKESKSIDVRLLKNSVSEPFVNLSP